jgi:hypothetical protein
MHLSHLLLCEMSWATKRVSSGDWAALTAGAKCRQLDRPGSPRRLACLWQLDRVGTEIEELTARPRGGRSDPLGVGAGPDGDAGGERRWLLSHGHTRYLRSSNP